MWSLSMRGGFAFFLLLVLFHNGSSATAQDQIEKRVAVEKGLPRATIPQSYEIKLVPEIVGNCLKHHGEAKIVVKVVEKTTNVTLHSKDLYIYKSLTSLVDADGVTYKPKNHTHVEEKSLLIIEFDEPISIGTYTLNLNFASDKVNSSGLTRTWDDEDNQEVGAIFTRLSANRSTLFPCWDEPDLRATFNLSIKHSPIMRVLSNMPVRDSWQDYDGKHWTNFHCSPPLSTRLVAFFISKFDCIENSGEIRFCGVKNVLPTLKFAHQVSKRALDFLQRNMGFRRNSLKMDLLAVSFRRSNNSDIGSAWGLKILDEYNVKYEAFKDPASKKIDVALMVIGNVIRQWTDNLIPSWTESEQYAKTVSGLSNYLQYYIADKLYPDWKLMQELRVLMTDDWTSNWEAAIFRMLCITVSEDVCIPSIARFLKKNQNRISTVDDLWESVQSTYDAKKKLLSGDVSVKEVMESWPKDSEYPVLNVTRDYKSGQVMITQLPSSWRQSNDTRWWVPINLATKSNHNTLTTTVTHWLKPGVERLIIDGIDKDDWIIINYQLTGFYNTKYDTTNSMRLAQYMNSENYSTIPVWNRAQILCDLKGAEYIEGGLPILLKTTEYLSREVEYFPWAVAITIPREWSKTIYDYKVYGEFAQYFVKLMHKVIEKFGFEDRSTYTWEKKYKQFYYRLDSRKKGIMPVEEALKKYYKGYQDEDLTNQIHREDILLAACELGHKQCLNSAKYQLEAYKKNPSENPISPNLVKWVRCYGAEGNEDYLLKTAVGYESLDLTSRLRCLQCSSNKTALWKYFEGVLSHEIQATESEFYRALAGLTEQPYVSRNHTYIRGMVVKVLKNYDKIYKHFRDIGKPDRANTTMYVFVALSLRHNSFTVDEIKEIQGLVKNATAFVHPHSAEVNPDIQLILIDENNRVSSIISKWLRDNTSPISPSTIRYLDNPNLG